MGAFNGKSPEEVRREIDRTVRWQREGIQDGTGTGCDAVHACATANRPDEILYFLRVAPEDAVEHAAAYLTRLRTQCDFLVHPYLGRMTPEESWEILQALQPVYRRIHDLFFEALPHRRGGGESAPSPAG